MIWRVVLHQMDKMTKAAGKPKKRLGERGEDLAVRYLEENGYIILARNYRALSAEIDIICRDRSSEMERAGDIVFVEVKTRISTSHGSPIESITQQKLKHIRRAADHYLFYQKLEDIPCRFDAIGIQLIAGNPIIEHMKDILDY